MQQRNDENKKQWTLVLPFFNEEAYLADTLASLAAQTLTPKFILVDNASTDASNQIAREFQKHNAHLDIRVETEARPGKSSALATGISLVDTEFTATADADTYYPPDYLQRTQKLFDKAGATALAVLAFGAPRTGFDGRPFARLKNRIAVRLMPRQTHSGGYGQSFRTEALKSVGGFTPEIWPYCLMDHEIMHRLIKSQPGARLIYDSDHWCAPSSRRSDRRRVRWTLPERLLYHVTPFSRRDWFFYDFLQEQFDARGLSELNLRRKEWSESDDQSHETTK